MSNIIKRKSRGRMTISIDIYVYQEDSVYVAYSPALDVSSSGLDANSAINSFHEAFELLITYTLSKGTFDKYLESLGWVTEKKPFKKLIPPDLNTIRKANSHFDFMLRSASLQKISQNVAVPV